MPRTGGVSFSALGALLLGVLTACEPEVTPPSSPTVRDSAGVEIVENGDATLDSSNWSLSPEPVFQVGTLEGAPELQLHRVLDGLILDRGDVAIVNGGSQEVRFYGASGEYRGAQGLPGEGPGEYRGLQSIFRLPADSILAWDMALRRATVIGPQGELARTLSPSQDLINPSVVGTFDDGTFLVADARFDPGEATGDWQQLHSTITRFSGEGEPLASLGTFPWYRMKFMVATNTRAEALRLGFDRDTQVAVRGDRSWIGTTKAYEVLEYEPTGRLSRILRWEGPDRSVTETHLDAYLEERLASAPNDDVRRLVRADHENRVFAEQFPAYSSLLVDDGNRIWVESYRSPGSPTVKQWVVFSDQGIPRGSLEISMDLRLLDIRGDQVLVVLTDDLGVEYLQLLRIEKG